MDYRRINSAEYSIVRLLMVGNIWWLACKAYKKPWKALKTVLKLTGNFKRMMGNNKLVRAFKTNDGYVWDIYNPAWPSKAFNSFFTNHLHEIEPIAGDYTALRRLLIAITKKCPLHCEHCSEGDTLHAPNKLTYDEFISKIDPYVKKGVGQLVYSGGEPLSRFDDLIKFISRYKKSCNQWIYTSAFGLTAEKARLLKHAGLNGAAISIDHHLEEEHNRFRGNKNSYYWVLEGIRNLRKAGIFVAINVCPTKKYIELSGIEGLIELAGELNVPIVNILEPRSVGHYNGKNVELEMKHKEYLLKLSNKFNYSKPLFNYPSVFYPAAFRRALPCGGGRSYLLIDYDGTLYPCPFCKIKMSAPADKEKLCEAV